MSDSLDLAAADRHLFHPYTAIAEQQAGPALVITDGEGVWLRDAEGREYLDAMAGLWCVNVGYGRDEITDAMAEQSRRLSYYHAFLGATNEPGARLAERIAGLTPPGLDHVFFCNSGSEANDSIIKMVWYHWNLRGRPEKKKIIARHGAYHGVTLGATSLSGLPAMHERFDLPGARFLHVTRPHHYREARLDESEAAFALRLAAELEERIVAEGPDTVAAFFGEPLMAAGGVLPPPAGYWAAVQEVCRRHEVLLVADEVVCGFGRLGHCFGSDRYQISPDFMTLAKGTTSSYFPVSAVVVADAVWNVFAEASQEVGPFQHGHTTSVHPVGAAAALANLDILEREGLFTRATAVGPPFLAKLREALGGHPLVGDVRGEGLIAAVELVADPDTRTPFPPAQKTGLRLYRLLLEEGLISRAAAGDSMAFSPPLSITPAELDLVVERFVRGLDRLTKELA